MATIASGPAEGTSRIPTGVAPLRAGQGRTFLWRRLHSLSGIVPVGAFILEHFISNAFATNGPWAYSDQVKFLTGLPFVVWLEVFGIYIPILYHALYGFYIWYRGESNVGDYPFIGNWMYTVQRWTGAITFFFIVWHTYTMRFTGEHLLSNYEAAFWKVQQDMLHPYAIVLYVVGILCVSFHFSYGLYLFVAKWGIVRGPKGRRNFAYVSLAVGIVLVVVGMATIYAFAGPRWPNTPKNLPPQDTVVRTH